MFNLSLELHAHFKIRLVLLVNLNKEFIFKATGQTSHLNIAINSTSYKHIYKTDSSTYLVPSTGAII